VGLGLSAVETGSGQLEVACCEFGALPTRLIALRQGPLCVGIANSDSREFGRGRRALCEGLGISIERTLFAHTHNRATPDSSFAEEIDSYCASLAGKFQPAEVSWGTAVQDQLTYNRKGRRKNGDSFYLWEEERSRFKSADKGPIDDTASVVRFDDASGAPLALLAHFTGHSGHPADVEKSGLVPGYAGWAMLQLSKPFHPHYPVSGFLQGCAGDVNAKYLGKGPRRAREVGVALGKSFVEAAVSGRHIEQPLLAFAQANAVLRYASLPSKEQLQRDRCEVVEFLQKLDAGDGDARVVLGCNLPKTMLLEERSAVARRLLRWCEWALGGPLLVDRVNVPIQVLALGKDVAFVFMPGEPFVGIGLSIRERSPFPLTLPVAYTNSLSPGYIGQAKDLNDRDYMSGYHRQALTAPFAKPWGDMIAFKALELLHEVKLRLTSPDPK
jgi:hypothetical protein